MSPGLAVATATTFLWLGMVLAISFLETPLKFRAPDVTLRIGLGIGRLVFRALNAVEAVLAVMLMIAIVATSASAGVVVAAAIAVVTLAAQVALVRPQLTRRTNRILAGVDAPRSHSHHFYIALEIAKTLTLIVTGILLLRS